jgi:hypothetical protein
MNCPKCQAALSPADIKFYVEAPTSVEMQLSCACGETFSTWIEHTAWADSSSEPVDLTAYKPRAQRVKGGRS